MQSEEDARAYRYLADEIIRLFNPPDRDAAEESILVDALGNAAEWIEKHLCRCQGPDNVCGRCEALGRYADQPVER
jgi:hypothetical protein